MQFLTTMFMRREKRRKDNYFSSEKKCLKVTDLKIVSVKNLLCLTRQLRFNYLDPKKQLFLFIPQQFQHKQSNIMATDQLSECREGSLHLSVFLYFFQPSSSVSQRKANALLSFFHLKMLRSKCARKDKQQIFNSWSFCFWRKKSGTQKSDLKGWIIGGHWTEKHTTKKKFEFTRVELSV